MRVWVYPEKVYEDFGAKRWEVEWYEVTEKARARVAAAEAKGEYDEFDIDRDIVARAVPFPHRSKGLAIAFAKRKAHSEKSAFGHATVTEQTVDWYVEEDRIAEWVNVGEPISVD
jgi:hypothetical protein